MTTDEQSEQVDVEDSVATEASHRRMLILAYGIVFLSSMAILVIELVAGRLIAASLGSSLYTWTSVIGVVLMGIAIGNWFGGRLADRYEPRRILPRIFLTSSILTFSILILYTLTSGWDRPTSIGWPYWVALNVLLIFFLPSASLGTISPVVAKLALDQGWSTGATVGNVYAWGATGSIVGTFITGFVLIEAFGTRQIIAAVAIFLALIALALALWGKSSTAGITVALVMLVGLSVFAFADAAWAVERGVSMNLRFDLSIYVFHDESSYAEINVYDTDTENVRAYALDDLVHGYINTEDPTILEYDYAQAYAALTHRIAGDTDTIDTLMIGGGGYVFPRYMALTFPGSRSHVIEIDPKVKAAAEIAFFLPPDDESGVVTYFGDARNVVSDFVQAQAPLDYQFVYLDAFNDFSVPFHLTTLEFNEQIASLLTDDGVYIQNLIDIFNNDHGRFLGAYVATLHETFDYVYVFGTHEQSPTGGRETFVVAASQVPLELDEIGERDGDYLVDMAPVAKWEGVEKDFGMTNLLRRDRGLILTDNYAPVANLIAGLYATQ